MSKLDDVLPLVLPAGWERIQTPPAMFAIFPTELVRFFRYRDGGQLIATIEDAFPDKSVWLHISFSYPTRLPKWDELVAVKNIFLGKKRLAIQLLPQEEDYVNIHQNTLHLYTRLDGDTLPGLAPGGRTLT